MPKTIPFLCDYCFISKNVTFALATLFFLIFDHVFSKLLFKYLPKASLGFFWSFVNNLKIDNVKSIKTIGAIRKPCGILISLGFFK